MPATELAVEGLTIRFGGLTAVDGIGFEVRGGEVLSLIGPNGAGKTTAFNAITGYIEPAAGEIRYRGTRLNGLEPHAIAALGVVRTFQKTSVFAGQSVRDNVAIGLHLRSRQRPLAILLGLPSVAREEKELAREAGRDPALRRARGAGGPKSPHRCPMASCGCWRWRWRWRRGRSCCCSTSRCRA